MAPVPTKTSKFDTALILPALVVCILYAAFLALRGFPGSAELTAKQRALADAQAAAVSPEEVQRLQRQQAELKQKSEDAMAKLTASRREAESLARKRSAPLGRIEVLAQIEDLLKRHRVEVTRVKASSDQADSKLAASLQKATSALAAALAKSGVKDDKAGPAAPLSDIERVAQFEEQAEASRMGIAPGANLPSNAPPLDLRELELRGDYHDLLTALHALQTVGGDSVVVSLGFERAEAVGGRALPLVWRMVLHVQPSDGPSARPPSHPTTPAELPRLASEREAKLITPALIPNN
jgi:hypothetical protein